MISVSDHIARLKRLRAGLPALASSAGTDYADNAVALRKESSIETGINRDGAEGSKVAYSTKPVPTYWLAKKAINQGGRDYAKKNKTGTWYGMRQAEGLRSTVVNLTHTGDMWKGYRVIGVAVSSGHVRVSIGATGTHADVFAHNVKRYGKFYLNSSTELARLHQNLQRDAGSWLRFTRL